jgi:hypothetical protein
MALDLQHVVIGGHRLGHRYDFHSFVRRPSSSSMETAPCGLAAKNSSEALQAP